MVRGTGISIVEIARIRRVLNRRPAWLNRWFGDGELDRAMRRARPEEEITGRLACKMAVRSALQPCIRGEALVQLNQILTSNDELGKPLVALSDAVRERVRKEDGGAEIHVSITHARDYAAAIAVISWTVEQS